MEDEIQIKIEDVRHFIYKTVMASELEAQTTDGWEFIEVVPDECEGLGAPGYSSSGDTPSIPGFGYRQSKYLLRKCSMLPDVAAMRQLLVDHQAAIEKADKEKVVTQDKVQKQIVAAEIREDEKSDLITKYREKYEDQLATTQLQADTLKMIKQKLGSVAFDDLVIG